MDNDRKVNELVEQSKQIFLREAIEEYKKRHEGYDLETEFAKTRKNRTILVPGVILAMLLVFLVGVFAVNFYNEKSTADVELDINEFRDINLREVLESWLQVENNIEETETNLDILVDERDSQIRLAERMEERQLALLEATEIEDDERSERIEEIESDTEELVAGIRDEYDPRIEELEEELSDLQRRKEEEFDPAKVEAALDRREVLEDEGRLQRLEFEQQKEFFLERLTELREAYEEELALHDEYSEELRETLISQHEEEMAQLEEELTLRYNPDISDKEIVELIETSPPEVPSGRSYRRVLDRTGTISETEYDALKKRQSEFDQIITRLQDVPYENSIPDALEHLEAREGAVAGEYDRIWNELADSYENLEDEFAQREQELEEKLESSEARFEEKLANRSGELESFEYALREFIVEDRENGFVVDARDETEIHVVIDRIYDIEDGTRGVVFREQEGYVAVISFYEQNDRIRAEVEHVAEGRRIRPFDRILVQIGGIDLNSEIDIPEIEEAIESENQ